MIYFGFFNKKLELIKAKNVHLEVNVFCGLFYPEEGTIFYFKTKSGLPKKRCFFGGLKEELKSHQSEPP